MIKKTFQAFFIFAIFQVFVFSCCTEDYNMYYDTPSFVAEDHADGDAASVKTEDLVLNFETVFRYILASDFKELKKFSNTALATTCDRDYILKEFVSEVEITANQDILGISSGESLNSKMSYINPETLEKEAVENILEVLNNGNGYFNNRKEFVLNEAITAGTTLSFTIKITIAEIGRTLQATTETITIE